MAGYSKVIVIGWLSRDAEVRYTPSGKLNVSLSIPVSRQYRDNSGQQQEQTSWFNVKAFGNLADTLVKLSEQGALLKGKQVYVEGRLEAREWTDRDGRSRMALDVMATELRLLGSRSDSLGDEGGFGTRAGDDAAGRAGGDAGGRAAAQGGRDADDFDGPGGDIDEVPF